MGTEEILRQDCRDWQDWAPGGLFLF